MSLELFHIVKIGTASKTLQQFKADKKQEIKYHILRIGIFLRRSHIYIENWKLQYRIFFFLNKQKLLIQNKFKFCEIVSIKWNRVPLPDSITIELNEF